MRPQVLGQALVGRVRLGRKGEGGQLVLQAAAGHGQPVPVDLARRMTVTQAQAGPEQFGNPPRETDGPPRRRRRHLVGPPQQVVQALLVAGVLESVVRGPAVVDHNAVVAEAQDGLGHAATAGRVDRIMEHLEPARATGLDVSFDIYPYPAGSSIPVSFLPSDAQEGGPDAILARLRDPSERRRIAVALDAQESLPMAEVILSYVPRRPELEGMSLVEHGVESARDPLGTREQLLCVCSHRIDSDSAEAVAVASASVQRILGKTWATAGPSERLEMSPGSSLDEVGSERFGS